MIVKVKLLSDKAIIPAYQTEGAAGFDLHSTMDCLVYPRKTTIVGTGLAFEIPLGYEIQIRSRSGLAFKQGITAFPGTIDSDFRGEVKILLFNNSDKPVYLQAGDRVAQGVLNKVEHFYFVEAEELGETKRGSDGFGSTGK